MLVHKQKRDKIVYFSDIKKVVHMIIAVLYRKKVWKPQFQQFSFSWAILDLYPFTPADTGSSCTEISTVFNHYPVSELQLKDKISCQLWKWTKQTQNSLNFRGITIKFLWHKEKRNCHRRRRTYFCMGSELKASQKVNFQA